MQDIKPHSELGICTIFNKLLASQRVGWSYRTRPGREKREEKAPKWLLSKFCRKPSNFLKISIFFLHSTHWQTPSTQLMTELRENKSNYLGCLVLGFNFPWFFSVAFFSPMIKTFRRPEYEKNEKYWSKHSYWFQSPLFEVQLCCNLSILWTSNVKNLHSTYKFSPCFN